MKPPAAIKTHLLTKTPPTVRGSPLTTAVELVGEVTEKVLFSPSPSTSPPPSPLLTGDSCGCFPPSSFPQVRREGPDGKSCVPWGRNRDDLERVRRTELGYRERIYPFWVRAVRSGSAGAGWVGREEVLKLPDPEVGVPHPQSPPTRTTTSCSHLLGGRVLVGVFATKNDLQKVFWHRTAVSRAAHPCVVIKYVIGGKILSGLERAAIVAANETGVAKGDWVLLEDTVENMNQGKSLYVKE